MRRRAGVQARAAHVGVLDSRERMMGRQMAPRRPKASGGAACLRAANEAQRAPALGSISPDACTRHAAPAPLWKSAQAGASGALGDRGGTDSDQCCTREAPPSGGVAWGAKAGSGRAEWSGVSGVERWWQGTGRLVCKVQEACEGSQSDRTQRSERGHGMPHRPAGRLGCACVQLEQTLAGNLCASMHMCAAEKIWVARSGAS